MYRKKPIFIKDGIPYFTQEDNYTKNYEKISEDHIKGLDQTGQNPFMPSHLVEELELKTQITIERYCTAGSVILDAGVGYGGLLGKLNNYQKYGVDISNTYLRRLPDDIEGCYSKLEDLPYNDKLFDAVISTDVLEHVIDMNSVLCEIKRVLKNNGLFILRVPLEEKLEQYTNSNMKYEFVHLRNFDKSSILLQICKPYGFKLVEFIEMGFLNDTIKCQTNYHSCDPNKINNFLNNELNKLSKDSKEIIFSIFNLLLDQSLTMDIKSYLYSFLNIPVTYLQKKKIAHAVKKQVQKFKINRMKNDLITKKMDQIQISDYDAWTKIFPIVYRPTELLCVLKSD